MQDIALYPELIAKASALAVAMRAEIEELKVSMARKSAVIDIQVAQNKELKNELERKAFKLEQLMRDECYQNEQTRVHIVEAELAYQQIEVERLKNEFLVVQILTGKDAALTALTARVV